jgi:hypothetical protein
MYGVKTRRTSKETGENGEEMYRKNEEKMIANFLSYLCGR